MSENIIDLTNDQAIQKENKLEEEEEQFRHKENKIELDENKMEIDEKKDRAAKIYEIISKLIQQLPDPTKEEDLKFSKKQGTGGLDNLGNTCYLNVTVQCLSHTPLLTKYFLTGAYKQYLLDHLDDEKVILFVYYIKLLFELWSSEGKSIKPNLFVKLFTKYFPQGGIFRQNDAQESIVFLLDTFHELISRKVNYTITGDPQHEFDKLMLQSIKELTGHYNNTHSFIVDIFSGQEHLMLQCTKCDKITHKFPPFTYTCLPLDNNNKLNSTIYNCFDLHCKTEVLDKDNAWECTYCKEKNRAYKRTLYWKFPNVLIISLNRFQIKNIKNNYFNIKVDSLVNYPVVNLDLSEYITNPTDNYLYNLYGIICHTGDVNSGHYYCYCLNTDGIWYRYNDENVTAIANLNNLITKDAYVLFYYKK